MAQLEIDILSLFGEYFGYTGLPYLPAKNTAGKYIADRYDKADIKSFESYQNKKDMLGRPVFLPVELGTMQFDIVQMTISAQKQIVKTAVAGRQGTIKELISTQDYKISLKGFLVNYDDNNYPEDKVEELKQLFDIDEAITIKSRVTDIFEITKVVIESLNLQETKHQNIQPFTLSLLSDDDFTAILNNV